MQAYIHHSMYRQVCGAQALPLGCLQDEAAETASEGSSLALTDGNILAHQLSLLLSECEAAGRGTPHHSRALSALWEYYDRHAQELEECFAMLEVEQFESALGWQLITPSAQLPCQPLHTRRQSSTSL